MTVEFVPAAHVRQLTGVVTAARQRALDGCGTPPPRPDARYWEMLFEANAAAVLAVLPDVKLTAGFVVRYRFYEQRGRDLLVRPFVARSTTDVEAVRCLLEWHAPPDSIAATTCAATHDVELLYRHFSFPRMATGFFAYWLAMQELWASQRWVHSHLIASAAELSQITAGDGWQIIHPIETYEPAAVRNDDGSARLAVLVECPLGRLQIALQQIEIAADQSVRYSEPILVASGPPGYAL